MIRIPHFSPLLGSAAAASLSFGARWHGRSCFRFGRSTSNFNNSGRSGHTDSRKVNPPPPSLSYRSRGQPTGSSVMRSARVQLRKRFGQHLLKNADVVRNIVHCAALKPYETVFEIGPGTGNLTVHLLEQALAVYAVELDQRLFEVLKSRVAQLGLSPKLQLVRGDFLQVQLPPFDALVANIPYQISSPVLKRLFEHRPLPSRAIIMFQKEFAERMIAQPGSSAYCRLSVNTQLLSSSVRIVMRIGREQFRPPPKVDSAVVEIIPHPNGPPANLDFADWDSFLRICFASKNKTLRSILGNKNVVAMLHQCMSSSVEAPLVTTTTTYDGEAASDTEVASISPHDLSSSLSSGAHIKGIGRSSQQQSLNPQSPQDAPSVSIILAASTTAAVSASMLGPLQSTSWGRLDRRIVDATRSRILSVLARTGSSGLRPNATPINAFMELYIACRVDGFRFASVSGSSSSGNGAQGRGFEGEDDDEEDLLSAEPISEQLGISKSHRAEAISPS